MPYQHTRLISVAAALSVVAASSVARADLDVRTLARARAALADRAASRAPVGFVDRDDFAAIVELPEGRDPKAFGLPRLGSHFSAVNGSLGDLATLAGAHPDWHVTWSPPLHPLLDRAAKWTHTTEFRNDTGFTGKGVIVGVVDTGVDLTHADLRNADGTTRVAYVVDFSEDGLGLYPDVEQRCTAAKLKCAVLGKTEIDDALSGGNADLLPTDNFGHGTHVASLAAGNGGSVHKYVGSAPESTIIVARVGAGSGDIGDASVLLAAQLIFELAESEGQKSGQERLPAVLNLSLGSDFGPHDGSSALERGLSELVGPDFPGRSIVVAAGNSGGLAVPASGSAFPSPLGVHTEVNVPEGPRVRVPLVGTPASSAGSTLNASMFVWIAYRPGDDLRVGVERRSGELLTPQAKGAARTIGDPGALQVTIVNGALNKVGLGSSDANSAVVIIEGKWPRSETFGINLEGHGTANLWVQSGGDLGPSSGALGTRFPAGSKESTVTMPASSASLIAVGATVNRLDWTDRAEDPIKITAFGSASDDLLDSVAFFSSAGPSADQRPKPDLVAPGAFVAGAMSRDADPTTGQGMFAEGGFCKGTDCATVDGDHGVAVGTSMASPIVAGAVALLLQGTPDLTQDRILTLLQAGARFPSGRVPLISQVGAGVMDLEGTLDVQRLLDTPQSREPSPDASWIAPAQVYAHPDPDWDVPFTLMLRDESGKIADGVTADDLDVTVDNGKVTSDVERVAPGFFRFSAAANRDTGGTKMSVEVYSGKDRLVRTALPIAVDYNVAIDGFAAHGGCAVGPAPSRAGNGALFAAITAWLGTRRRRAARTVRSRGRTDTSG